MTSPDKIAVVIPVYTNELTDIERKTLVHNIRLLHNYKVYIIKPNSLNFSIGDIQNGKGEKIIINYIDLDNTAFSSIASYNRLLLNKNFYKLFGKYDYMLICQLDTYIFKDSLMPWVNKRFDYIGAPWTSNNESEFVKMAEAGKASLFFKIMRGVKKIFFNKTDYQIGNGGLSLRRIKKFIHFLTFFGFYAKRWNGNEDIFWSVVAPLLDPFFRVPNIKHALGFSIEKEPRYYFRLNNDELPFGCHAWEKYDPLFWEKYISIEVNR